MKAIINGKRIEGTPQEIIEYERLQAQQQQEKIWPIGVPQVTSDGITIKRCAYPCNCSGACYGTENQQAPYMAHGSLGQLWLQTKAATIDANTDDWWNSEPTYRVGQMGG